MADKTFSHRISGRVKFNLILHVGLQHILKSKPLKTTAYTSVILKKVEQTLRLAETQSKPVVLAHTFHIDAVDLLPILTHPCQL